MQPENCFCVYCQTENMRQPGLDVPDGQWLEVLGEMIEVAVKGIGKQPSFTSCCNKSPLTV